MYNATLKHIFVQCDTYSTLNIYSRSMQRSFTEYTNFRTNRNRSESDWLHKHVMFVARLHRFLIPFVQNFEKPSDYCANVSFSIVCGCNDGGGSMRDATTRGCNDCVMPRRWQRTSLTAACPIIRLVLLYVLSMIRLDRAYVLSEYTFKRTEYTFKRTKIDNSRSPN